MLLPLAASGMDLDSDQDCGGLLNGVAEHFDILILGSGGKFDLQSADDMFTSPKLTADNKRDIPNPFTGTCEKQTPP